MDSNKLGQWLQIGANIGLLAGLILVALQIKQNSDLLRIQLLYEESNRASQNGIAIIGEDAASAWANSITSPGDLSLREQRVVEGMIWLEIENWRSAYRLSQLGLIEDDWKERVLENSTFVLNYPYGRAVWKHMAESVQPELAQFVDEQLSASDFSPQEYFKDVMRDALLEEERQ